MHVFDAVRRLNNLSRRCGMVASMVLRELLLPIPKIAGCMDLGSLRPLGLVELILQLLLGSGCVATRL